jgi:pimeloyl-ACP methyl ester carboxylesterase
MNTPLATTRTCTLEPRGSGLVFDVDVAGEPGRPLVLLLHGFPQTSHTWRHALPALAAAGYFAVAPNLRGYSASARPEGVASYATDLLVQDALNLARELGAERFHLVGHDWGGTLAWRLAAQHRERVHTLAVLSRPHPAAFAVALRDDPDQVQRSGHHRAFDDPQTARRLLESGARRLRTIFANQGVKAVDANAYVERLSDEAALNAALNWYRATRSVPSAVAPESVPAVQAPTLYMWGDADATVGCIAAHGTARHVKGPYRFEVVEGGGHFLTDEWPERVTRALLEHVQAHT